MGDAERLDRLREFGFGPYASRAYLALLDLGPSDARAVSRVARIPGPKVYGTLHQLMERGLVRSRADKPRRYEPVPFAEYLEQERAGHLEEAQRIGRLASTLAPLFSIQAKHAASDRGGVVVHRGRQPVLRLHRQLAARVRSELLIVPSVGAARRASTFSALLADTAASGVRARVLLPHGTPAAILAAIEQLADLRLVKPIEAGVDGVTTACFDACQVVLTHHVPDDDNATEGHDVAIHISEEAIARSIHEGLAARWAVGEDAKKPARRGRRSR